MLKSLRRQWRTGGQRGSILSALLIIVAFLAILGGALMNEISGQFLLTQTLGNRIALEATVNSSVEGEIGQLQTRVVPSRCSTDSTTGSPIALNGDAAVASPACQAIVPDVVSQLAPGSFPAEGAHITAGGRNRYLVGDTAGNLYSYQFGQTSPTWRFVLDRGVSASPAQVPDPNNPGHYMTAVPIGTAVELVDDSGFGVRKVCDMRASGTVVSQPGFETPPSGAGAFFPTYVFFGDSSGTLYVFNAETSGATCSSIAQVTGLGGPVVAGPLVLTGQQLNGNKGCGGDADGASGTQTVEIFAVVNSGGSGRLVQYEYCEASGNGKSGTNSLGPSATPASLSISTPAGVAYSSTIPVAGGAIRLAVTSLTGQLTVASIRVSSGSRGFTYSMATGGVAALGGSFSAAPYWCHCPGGDLIGAGNTNGTLYLFDPSLSQRLHFDDGGIPINSSPAADVNGDWYFGADDGYIHDVEPPASGAVMFPAAKFGPGMPVRGSAVVGGPADGCGGNACLYFGASNGSGFAQIGSIRVMDLRACPTSSPGSTICAGGPRLWARVEVGNPAYVGGRGALVLGWSYHGS